jgi:phage N-6-adenine-methyltransferase
VTELVKWTQIKANGGTQMRLQLNQETVTEYADAMRSNSSYKPFPAVVVYFDGSDYWLADGFHRHAAAGQAFGSGCSLPSDVRAGTRRDAILHAAGANADHGQRRTNADKQRSVETLLRDDEWGKWSNREIARRCNVSESFVRSLRTERSEERAYTTKHGTTATMNTSRIGAQPAPTREYAAAVPTIAAITEPEPALNPDRSRPLTDEEAAAVVWRVIGRLVPQHEGESQYELAHRRVNWLRKATFSHFIDAIKPGVIFTYSHYARIVNEIDSQLMALAKRPAPTINKPQPTPPIVEPATPVAGDEEPQPEEEKADSDEWYTPRYVIDAARKVLGKIDLDPASCAEAQQVIRAMAYASKANDSLRDRYPWLGRIWLNPPYSNPLPWVEKLFQQYEAGNVRAALLLVNTTNSPQWARMLWQSEHRVCLLSRRIKFWRPDRPDGKGFDRDQMIWYLGKDPQSFADVFSEWGAIR